MSEQTYKDTCPSCRHVMVSPHSGAKGLYCAHPDEATRSNETGRTIPTLALVVFERKCQPRNWYQPKEQTNGSASP